MSEKIDLELTPSGARQMKSRNLLKKIVNCINGNIECTVRFEDNPNFDFHDGDTLNGIIEVKLDRSLMIQKLSWKVKGLVEYVIVEGSGKHAKAFYNKETLFSVITDFISSPTTLNSGKHQYKFKYVLPKGVPSSFKQNEGRTRYAVSLIFERPWRLQTAYDGKFNVVRTTDLNKERPELRKRLEKDTKKKFMYLFKESEPILMTASLPKSGFITGEVIPITIDVSNPTETAIEYINIKLIQMFTLNFKQYCFGFLCFTCYKDYFVVTGIKKHDKTVIKASCLESIVKGNKQYIINLKIPDDVTPSSLDSCKILDISYRLKIKGVAQTFYTGPLIEVPIVIGNVPYNE